MPDSGSFFRFFFSRIAGAIQPQETKLAGRIGELKAKFQGLYEQLYALDVRLQKKERSFLEEIFLEEVVKPKLREAQSLQHRLLAGSGVGQVKVFGLCADWIECVGRWLQLYRTDGESYGEELRNYLEEGVAESLEKDIRVVQEYFEQAVAGCEDREGVRRRVEEKIEPFIQKLAALRNEVVTLDLEEFHNWKKRADKAREQAFERALSSVDSLIGEHSPEAAGKGEHAHLLDLVQDITEMEEAVSRIFIEMIEKGGGEVETGKIRRKISILEWKAHEMHLDLQLPQSICDRLVEVEKDIAHIKELLG